jgi:membrane protease subunit (stomatin/prohibitin family)
LRESAKRAFSWGKQNQPAAQVIEAQTSPVEPEDMAKCTKCGESAAYLKFCSNCGTQAPAKPVPRVEAEEVTDVTACAKCGAVVKYEKHCSDCGTLAPAKPAPKPKEKFCSDCGAKIETGKKFCVECGTKQ